MHNGESDILPPLGLTGAQQRLDQRALPLRAHARAILHKGFLLCSCLIAPTGALAASPPNCSVNNFFTLETNSTIAGGSGTFGAVSLAATEASTTRVLQIVGERREQETRSCPDGMERIGGNCVAKKTAGAATPVTPTTSQSTNKSNDKTSSPPSVDYGVSESDIALNGAWTEGFFEYEERSGLASGVTRKQKYGGFFVGADHTFRFNNREGWVVGAQGGYSAIDQDFEGGSSVTVTRDDPYRITGVAPDLTQIYDVRLPTEHTINSTQQQDIDGPTAGMYASYFHKNFFADFLVRSEFFDLTRITTSSDTHPFNLAQAVVQANAPGLEDPGCVYAGPPNAFTATTPRQANGAYYLLDTPVTEVGTTRQTLSYENYVFANNVGYRFELQRGYWVEPTFTTQYTFSDFGGDAAALGLTDGHALRLQGGAKYGNTTLTPQGFAYTLAAGGYLYSDVLVEGFAINDVDSPGPNLSDEGLVRVMGILEAEIDWLNGYSVYGTIESRGGEDVWAVGGKVGARVEW